MVLIESVKSVRLILLAMTLWSSTMLFLFIMVLKQKRDSTRLRMKKITETERFLGRLKRNSSLSILSQQDTAKRKHCSKTKMCIKTFTVSVYGDVNSETVKCHYLTGEEHVHVRKTWRICVQA